MSDTAPAPSTPTRRLEWQSWLVLAAVVPWCAITAIHCALAVRGKPAIIAWSISALLTLLVWLARAATPMAALTGGLLAALFTLSFGGNTAWYRSALPPLLVLFVLTFSSTRYGRAHKQRLGVAEDRRGRNAAQIAANLGMAGLGAATALQSAAARGWCAVAVLAAFAEATADTLASELGEVLGGSPFLITSGRRVPAGTDGAVSFNGTAAGIFGAALIALTGMAALQLNLGQASCALLGAVVGFFVDSLLGATAERHRWINNDAVNFLSTAVAFLAAALFERL